jgi:hypothetical protein
MACGGARAPRRAPVRYAYSKSRKCRATEPRSIAGMPAAMPPKLNPALGSGGDGIRLLGRAPPIRVFSQRSGPGRPIRGRTLN